MMLRPEIKEEIKNRIGEENVLFEEPMADHTSMKVGGPAAYYFTPESPKDAGFLLRVLKRESFPFYVIGNGSNLIVHDEGYPGAIIDMMKLKELRIEGEYLTAQCGVLLKEIAEAALSASLTGFEFASGIPGSLGGAVTMNAGAYDGEMKDIVTEVVLLDPEGNLVTKTGKEMDFSYRHSLCSSGEYIVISATLALAKGDGEVIRGKMDDLAARRNEKQPMEYPSCGSTFKRPEGYFAGKLITDAGLKGYRIGGAQVSEKHAGFIINRDHATAEDILSLIRFVQQEVMEKFGVELRCEVKII